MLEITSFVDSVAIMQVDDISLAMFLEEAKILRIQQRGPDLLQCLAQGRT